MTATLPSSLNLYINIKKSPSEEQKKAEAKWKTAVVREMVNSGEILQSNQYWGGHLSVLSFLREHLEK